MYVDLVPNLETPEFITSLKWFIAQRGRPQRIYSDNGKTFVSESKWIQQVMKDERSYGYLGKCKDAVWSRWTKEYLRGIPGATPPKAQR